MPIDAAGLVEGERVHSRVYTDPAIFALERERIFRRVWLFLGHTSQIPNVGDYVAATMAGAPVLVVRQKDGGVAALINRCTHRGAQVCQTAAGTTARFRCPYHGWTFGLDGGLIGVPLRAGYPATFDLRDPALSLARVPRVEIYRGFIFGCHDSAAPPLVEWLGPARSSIDNMVDRAPLGDLELAGGVHRHSFRGNWKLQMENLNDYAHPAFAHESSNQSARPAAQASDEIVQEDIMAANRDSDPDWIAQAGVVANPGGHSYIGGLPLEAEITPAARAEYLAAMHAHYGEQRTAEILGVARHVEIIYPTLATQGYFQQVKVIQPVAVDHTEVYVYSFHLKGAPREYHRAAVTFVNAANSPASLILTDDLAIYERAQQAMTAAPGWLRFANGLGRSSPDNAGGMRGPGMSELAMRHQFNTWRAFMGGEGDPYRAVAA